MTARAALIVNAASRSGEASFAAARQVLTDLGVALGHCALVRPAQLRQAVKDAAVDGHRAVIVGGGDGSLGTAAGVMADLPTGVRPVLGVLPLGTANDFARTLDIPTRLEDACATLAHGKVVDVDVGRADGEPFLNAASVGLSVEVTRALRPGLKRRLGPAAYPVAALLAYRHLRPFRARLTSPHGDFEALELDDLLQVAVGNGRHYGGGNTIAPDAGIDDDTLDVYAIRRGRFRDHLSIARLLRSGSLIEHDQVLHLTTRAVHLTTYDESPVNLDGELVGTTPVLFEVEPNAVDVVVPQHVSHLRHDAALSWQAA